MRSTERSTNRSSIRSKSSYHMTVAVRIRPALQKKYEIPSTLDTSTVFSPHVLLPPQASQSSMYSTVTMDLLTKIRNGFNCSIIAYGQTGSGKTHTIFGPAGKLRRLVSCFVCCEAMSSIASPLSMRRRGCPLACLCFSMFEKPRGGTCRVFEGSWRPCRGLFSEFSSPLKGTRTQFR